MVEKKRPLKKKVYVKKQQEIKTTGHEWDGIKEYDTPDPFWLRVLFYITLFFSLGYWLLYPSWPTPNNVGILDWDASKELQADLDKVQEIRAKYQAEFDKADFKEIMQNDSLLEFALAGGSSAFQNNCAVCHGVGAQGSYGYPNLTTGAWLWGGTIEDIYTTLKYGIRSGHIEARDSQMAAFGRDGLLTKEQINLLVDYVLALSTPEKVDTNSKAHKIFQENCASCHGSKGEGSRMFGAPALNDAIWLYGKDRESIYDVIYNGRAGVMPYWSGKLSDSTIKQLAIYVHQLGGGE